MSGPAVVMKRYKRKLSFLTRQTAEVIGLALTGCLPIFPSGADRMSRFPYTL